MSTGETRKVTFHAGNRVGQSDDEQSVQWDDCNVDKHELVKKALLWSAGRWPESDGEYAAAVWIEEDGEVIASEDVTISPDGEMEFPA